MNERNVCYWLGNIQHKKNIKIYLTLILREPVLVWYFSSCWHTKVHIGFITARGNSLSLIYYLSKFGLIGRMTVSNNQESILNFQAKNQHSRRCQIVHPQNPCIREKLLFCSNLNGLHQEYCIQVYKKCWKSRKSKGGQPRCLGSWSTKHKRRGLGSWVCVDPRGES